MNVAVMKTKAEQAYVEQFDAVAHELPGRGWVPAARRTALGAFAAHGLPHRRIEDWKYTDLRALIKAVPPAAPLGSTITDASLAGALGAELAALECHRLVFVNGRFASSHGVAPEGIEIGSLADALGAAGFDWLEPHFASRRDAEPLFELNTAFVSGGAVIRVADGSDLARPIHLVFVTDGATASSTAIRNLVLVGEGARCLVVESHVTLGEAADVANAVTEFDVMDGAEATHVKHVRAGPSAAHLGTWRAKLGANATYRGFQLNSGTKVARNTITATFAGEGGKLDLSGAFLARADEHLDTTLVVDHAVPHCESRELYKGVLDGRSRGIFQGKIIVRPDAQKTDGKQMAQALMLSPDAEFDSKPELEIYADDVVCGHGATAAELDDELVFYCRSRGIPAAEARALLTESFIGEALDKIEHDGLREALMANVRRWLTANAAGT